MYPSPLYRHVSAIAFECSLSAVVTGIVLTAFLNDAMTYAPRPYIPDFA